MKPLFVIKGDISDKYKYNKAILSCDRINSYLNSRDYTKREFCLLVNKKDNACAIIKLLKQCLGASVSVYYYSSTSTIYEFIRSSKDSQVLVFVNFDDEIHRLLDTSNEEHTNAFLYEYIDMFNIRREEI